MRTTMFKATLITGIFFLACNQQQSPQQSGSATQNSSATDSIPLSSWQVTGCARIAASTKSPATGNYQDFPEQKEVPGPTISAAGDSVTYFREVSHLCCRLVTVSTKSEQQTITFTEYWFRPGCKCRCSSTVRAVIHRLPKGTYQVYAIETGTDPVNDKPSNGADTLLRKQLSIQ